MNASASMSTADVRVRLPADAAAQVDVRPAAAELAPAVDPDAGVHASRRSRAGTRAPSRPRRGSASRPSRTTPVEAAVELEQLGDHRADPAGAAISSAVGSGPKIALCVTSRPIIVTSRPLVNTRVGRLGIGPDVELGRRRDVALADRAAHQHDPLDPRRASGCRARKQADVRQRAGRDERDRLAEAGARSAMKSTACSATGARRRRGQRRAVHPALAVDVLGDERLAARAAGRRRRRRGCRCGR